jgi:Zn-dependent peptidase ImmA (M78 family)/DNA-binding XRE family transcriptional regulator
MKADEMDNKHIGRRIKALRETRKMNQKDLAEILRLKDRQSVSALETGARRVTADELIRVVEHFGVSLQDISNPFLLYEKEGFSWRQNGVAPEDLSGFERKAGEWVGAYRTLAKSRIHNPRKLLPNLKLTHRSSFEDAVAAGESVADLLELPEDAPAHHLAEAIEEKFDILVLMVDTIQGVSGAACHVPELNAILINRSESPGRRRADMAHELFHILTWDVMKPERVESAEFAWDGASPDRRTVRNQRIEQLADNFNCGLLMPGWTLDRLPEPRVDAEWLNAAADAIGVTSLNLKWRLVNSRRVPAMAGVPRDELMRLAHLNPEVTKPPLYSRRFMEVIGNAIQSGEISVRRAAKMFAPSVEDLGELFDAHELERPEELRV